MFFRPTTSEADDQTNRPSMLDSERIDTNAPAAAPMTGAGPAGAKKSWEIGGAFSRMPMPAVTLKHSTTQSSQNCGSLIAVAADTAGPEPVAPGAACGG